MRLAGSYSCFMLFRKDIRFEDHHVSDLAWIIGSPPLMQAQALGDAHFLIDEEWCDAQWRLHLDWIRELDENPNDLHNWLDLHSEKFLGKRFEVLLWFWFEKSPYFELAVHGVQLKDGLNTSGEIDFIVFDIINQEWLHLEVACKYYLGAIKSAQWTQWIGPNAHDTLDLKMNKLRKQLDFASSIEVRTFLQEKKLETPRSIGFVKGYFFHHFSLMGQGVSPENAHRHYASGWYVRVDESGVFASELAQWLILPKEYWMSPYCNKTLFGDLLSGIAMIEHFRETPIRKGQLVLQVHKDGDWWKEVSRGFVVPNAWPSLR